MTDKKLLELAAKAAGYAFKIEVSHMGLDLFCVNGHLWNPLTDDGDALRLAVKLNMAVQQLPGRDKPCAEAWHNDKYARELRENDPCAATRRAIVRAAAEIGKGMK